MTAPATRHSPRHRMVGLMFGLWLTLAFVARLYIQVVTKNADDSFVISTAAIVWPPIFLLLSGHGLIPRGVDTTTALLLAVFVLTALISCVISPIQLTSLGFFVATLIGIYVAMQFGGLLTASDLALGLRLYSVCTVALLLAYAQYDYRTFEGYRLGEGTQTMNPNSLGMIAMSVTATAFSFRSTLVRVALVGVSLAIIFSTGSRAAAVAAIAAVSMILWFDFLKASLLKKCLVILPIVFGLLYYAATHWDTFYLAAEGFFRWDDRQRGIASGGSGRVEIWSQMWQIIRSNLLLGVGYRAHSEFLTIASSAHNGYLALFAEIGLFGFLAVMTLVVRRLVLLLRRYAATQSPMLAVYAAFFSGFLLLAIFERYLLNIGNPASLLFLVILFGSVRNISQSGRPARRR